MNVIEALNWRYAVKAFSDEKIPAQELAELLEAARLSASSYGLQPYNIVVVESRELREKLLPFSYGQDKVAHSSHLIVLAAHTHVGDVTVDRYINRCSEQSGARLDDLSRFSEHMKSALARKTAAQKAEWAHQQAYIALGNLLTSAALMGIDSCPMTGFDHAGYDAVLGLEEMGLTSSVICPVGRRHCDDAQAQNPKVRFSYDEIVIEV